jgi:hypothetical protein
MRLLLIIIIYISITNPAKAGFVVGTGFLYQNVNDSRFKIKNKYNSLLKPTSVSFGYIKEINNISLVINTNRFINRHMKSEVLVSGVKMAAKFKITYDLIQVGYKTHSIVPGLFIGNVKSRTTIVSTETKNTIIYGAIITKPLNRRFSTSLLYAAPNKELNIDGGAGFTINYYF